LNINNEIPIEARKMRGVTRLLMRKYLTKPDCKFSSTNFLFFVAYHQIKNEIKPVVARILAKDITTIL
jgi:hypothetical protein